VSGTDKQARSGRSRGNRRCNCGQTVALLAWPPRTAFDTVSESHYSLKKNIKSVLRLRCLHFSKRTITKTSQVRRRWRTGRTPLYYCETTVRYVSLQFFVLMRHHTDKLLSQSTLPNSSTRSAVSTCTRLCLNISLRKWAHPALVGRQFFQPASS
jgi:hypothetical protein